MATSKHGSRSDDVDAENAVSVDIASRKPAIMVRSTIHVWRMARFERTIGQKCTLYESYVPKLLRHGVLRDPNHSLRIEYTLQ